MIRMLAKKELIGHAGDVITNNHITWRHLRKLFIRSRHRTWRFDVESKKFVEALDRAVAVFGDFGPLVNMGVEKTLELSVLRPAFFAEPRQANSGPADIVYRSDAGIREQPVRRVDQIGSKLIEEAFQRLVEFEFFPRGGMAGVNLRIGFGKKRNFIAKNFDIEELCFERVIKIRGVIGDFINAIDKLRLKGRTQIQKVFGKLRKFRSGIIARMLDDALANFKREIQAGKIEVTLLELFNDAQRVQIVIETAAAHEHQLVELPFPGMAERRMADVVDESERFGKLGVQSQRRGDGAGNLRDFQRVRQAITEMVRIARSENLRLGFKAAKSAGMDDAIAVARVVTAVRMGRLRMAPAAGLFHAHRPGSKSGNRFDGPLRHIPATRANSYARSGSGFRRKRIQAAIGLIRNRGVREFLLDLLVDACGLFWVGIAKEAGKFQQHQRTRHKCALFVRQSTKDFDRIISLAGPRVNDRHLILRHRSELFVATADDLLQFFERLVVAFEVLETKRGIVASVFSGICAGIFVRTLCELSRSTLRARVHRHRRAQWVRRGQEPRRCGLDKPSCQYRRPRTLPRSADRYKSASRHSRGPPLEQQPRR